MTPSKAFAAMVPPDSLAAGAMKANAIARSLRDVEALRHAAAELIEAAMSIGCYHLVAANSAAEPLATAAALISNGEFKSTSSSQSVAEKVLVVDAATVSGNVTRACAAELRRNGATWVGALIFARMRPDLDGLDDEPLLDYVSALH